MLGYLTERDSAGSLTDTQSTIPTTLNEALKNFMRIIQRVAVPNLADQRKLDSISCLTHSRDNKGEKESSNKIYIEVLQRMESMAELTIQTAPSNINPTRNETYNSGTEVIDVSESDTPQSGLPSNRKVNEIYQNIKVSQNAATYHNQIGAQWPVGGDNFESSTMVSPSDSGTTKEISESRKNKVRRSQSLVSSLSHSRKNQWIDLESQWVDGLSVSTINSSKSLDRAIAQEVNTDSVTASEEEMAELLNDAISDFSSAAYRQLAHGIVKPCNGGDIQMVTNEHNRHNTYTEQFRLRQRMALNSNKSTKKMNTQKVTHVDLDPDKSDLTSSMGTANILALAETSDLLGDSSFRSLEKDLQNFCLESPTRKTELSDDIIPYEEHRNGKDTENQPDVTVGCNTTLIPTQRPQYRWSGVPNDSFWVSVGPPVSNMTVPCDAIHLDFRTRQLPFNSTTWFMQTAQNVPAWIPPVWMNTMDPGVIPQSGGPVIPYNYPPLSVMPPPNYLSFFAPPREDSNRGRSGWDFKPLPLSYINLCEWLNHF
ncbi:unnamed protein product [Echinostoma caproni]|uniref:Uncharacterized protein n=1 Tax=Echinostoma caproni TaxID=27848 RepID=A0A3P8HX14_9TREM|nr:unnamed protein product [Echinostoma caproni]